MPLSLNHLPNPSCCTSMDALCINCASEIVNKLPLDVLQSIIAQMPEELMTGNEDDDDGRLQDFEDMEYPDWQDEDEAEERPSRGMRYVGTGTPVPGYNRQSNNREGQRIVNRRSASGKQFSYDPDDTLVVNDMDLSDRAAVINGRHKAGGQTVVENGEAARTRRRVANSHGVQYDPDDILPVPDLWE